MYIGTINIFLDRTICYQSNNFIFYWRFQVRNFWCYVQIMSQDVQSRDNITPLHQLSKWTSWNKKHSRTPNKAQKRSLIVNKSTDWYMCVQRRYKGMAMATRDWKCYCKKLSVVPVAMILHELLTFESILREIHFCVVRQESHVHQHL